MFQVLICKMLRITFIRLLLNFGIKLFDDLNNIYGRGDTFCSRINAFSLILSGEENKLD